MQVSDLLLPLWASSIAAFISSCAFCGSILLGVCYGHFLTIFLLEIIESLISSCVLFAYPPLNLWDC